MKHEDFNAVTFHESGLYLIKNENKFSNASDLHYFCLTN